MSAAPLIFDRAALALRQARAVRLAQDVGGTTPDFLLRRVADDFSDRLHTIKRQFTTALDLECHHGLLGTRLSQVHGIASVTSASECVAGLALTTAPRVQIDLERLPFAPASFDLIVSGLALQTVNDLPGTLAQLRASLRPDGLFLASLLGGQTLSELRDAFLAAETEITGGASPRTAPMIDLRDLGTLLQRAKFALPVVDNDIVIVTYAHPLALLADLRGMGATNILVERSRRFLRRDVLTRAMAIYQQRHANADGRIRATFEILTATGWGPHENQQKPLKPGSASARLADALKAVPPSEPR